MALTATEKSQLLERAEFLKDAASNATDPSTRPTFDYVDAGDSSTPGAKALRKGFFPPIPTDDDDAQAKVKSFNINSFPRGDLDKFNPWRFALANVHARGEMGNEAFKKFAPYERAYFDALIKADLGDQVSGQDGGFLAPEQWSTNFIGALAPLSVVSALPVTRYLATTREVHFPRMNTRPTTYYSAENAALIASSPTFSQATGVLRKQSTLVYLSNELIVDSDPGALAIVERSMATQMAVDFDSQVLAGNGQAGTPTGLLNAVNVTTSGMAGAHLAYTDLTNGVYAVEVINNSTNVSLGQAQCSAVVGHPILKKQIANFEDSNGRPLWMYGLNGMSLPGSNTALADFLGVPKFVTSTVLTGTEGAQNIFFGDWQYLMIVERPGLEFLSSNVAGNTFAFDQTAVRVIRRFDVIVSHPEAFFVLTSVTS